MSPVLEQAHPHFLQHRPHASYLTYDRPRRPCSSVIYSVSATVLVTLHELSHVALTITLKSRYLSSPHFPDGENRGAEG